MQKTPLQSKYKIFFLVLLSLLAFAANSVLCRLALGEGVIDAAGFTLVRLFSGAVLLLLFILLKTSASPDKKLEKSGSWKGSIYLAVYAVTFSFAYVSVDTATGALILFAAVQLSMLCVGIFQGNRLSGKDCMGVVLAFSGLVYLLLPSIKSPSLQGSMLMLLSGTAWGLYSLNGRSSNDPLMDTAGNFVRTTPLLIILAIVFWPQLNLSKYGVALAVASGAVASALGYTLWYWVLPALQSIHAAVLQLLVPLIAAAGGVFFVGESLSLRLMLASVLTLGGILLVIIKPSTK